MLTLAFASLFVLTFISWSFETGHARWDLLLPGGLLAVFLVFAVSCKTVQMDEKFLYVSVFRRVVSIPLDQIATVTESIGRKIAPSQSIFSPKHHLDARSLQSVARSVTRSPSDRRATIGTCAPTATSRKHLTRH